MKEYFGNLVKFMVFGNFLISTVHSTTYYSSIPSFPYYQDDQYYIPNFVPPYPGHSPVYYSNDYVHPPPLPYENYYSSSQLFQQNKNYKPLEATKPKQTYEANPTVHYNQRPKYNQYDRYKISVNDDQNVDNMNQKNPSYLQHKNIYNKDKTYQPYYFDDLNKHYQDEEDSENDSGEVPSELRPCDPNYPYQYFQPDPNNPNFEIPLCNPYIQPNFVNAIYSLRAPITLFPSSFPPRIEQFIQKIQNFFSTYTEKETKKPLNQTEPASTDIPPDVTNESETTAPSIQEENNNKITTEEIQPPVEVSPEMEVTTGSLEKVTEDAEVVQTQSETIPEEDIFSTPQPDVSDESQTEMLSHKEVADETTPSLVESDDAVTVSSDNNQTNMATEGEIPSEDEEKNEDTKEDEKVKEDENKESTASPDAENENTPASETEPSLESEFPEISELLETESTAELDSEKNSDITGIISTTVQITKTKT